MYDLLFAIFGDSWVTDACPLQVYSKLVLEPDDDPATPATTERISEWAMATMEDKESLAVEMLLALARRDIRICKASGEGSTKA